MIIEQIRYYGVEDDLAEMLRLRRAVSRLREAAGLPAGQILVADPYPDEGPCLIWQCGYEDEAMLGGVETNLMQNGDYESIRHQLGSLVARIEVEIYLADEEDEPDSGSG